MSSGRDNGDSWKRLGRRLLPWSLLPGKRVRREVDEELGFHIEGRVRELVEAGWDEEAARREVLRRFGDVEEVRAACESLSHQRLGRKEWRLMIDSLRHDLRLAARALRKSPGFSPVVVLTLALGIGATTAIFSVVDGVLLTPLPYEDPGRLAIVWQNDRATGTVREPAATADYYDFRERSRSFEEMAMFARAPATLTRDAGEPRRVNVASVTASLDDVLGVEPARGRGIRPAEDEPGGPAMVVLSDRFWRSVFQGDEEVLGAGIRLDGVPHTVVGVLPPGTDFPSRDTDLWVPIQQSPAVAQRNPHFVTVVGRLAPDVPLERAQEEMTRIAAELEQEFPANANRGAFVESLQDVVRGDVELTLWVLLAAVGSVLLIACANVANLLLARGTGRSQEIAVCAALGASQGRLTRRFLVESLLLTGAGLAAGVALAVGGLRILLALAPGDLVAVGEVGVDGSVLAFAAALAGVIGLVFGLVPTLQVRRLDLQGILKEGRSQSEGNTGRMWLRRLLVVGQLGGAVVLLVAAGLLAGTLANLQSVDPGFAADNLLRLDFSLPDARYPKDMSRWPVWPETLDFNRQSVERVEAVPGVVSAAITSHHPLQSGFTNSFGISDDPPDPDQGEVTLRMVTPGYFETVGLPPLVGRTLRSSDDSEAPFVLVMNREAVERYLPQTDLAGALGRTVTLWGGFEWQVVGVVGNERMHGLDSDPPPAMYVSLLQAPQRSRVTMMVRTRSDPLALAGSVRQAIWSLDPDLALYNVSTMEETVADAVARERFASVLLGVFAAVALFLASLGVYGLLSYLVARRQREVGIRMALGATREEVLRRVLSQGMALALAGIGLGLAGALAVSRVLEGMLFGLTPGDPATYALVVASLGLAALVACTLPAWRAARTDPADSLRRE